MKNLEEPGKYYSFDEGRGYGITLSDGWFMAIEPGETLDRLPIWEIRTHDFLPEGLLELNVYDPSTEIPLEIRLALAAALHANRPMKNLTTNVGIQQT